MELIIHRGIGRENTLVGIMAALFHPPIHPPSEHRWCEIDVLWTGKDWILCHDFDTLSERGRHHSSLLSLVKTIDRYAHTHETTASILLIDVKWDLVFNRDHDMVMAMERLQGMVNAIDLLVWVQFGHLDVLELGRTYFPDSFIGFLLSQPLTVTDLPVHFLTVDLSAFSEQDLKKIRSYFIIGFTCTHLASLPRYTHLHNEIDAIVCDLIG